eukprot:3198616-Amphidinium_carterae.1
MALKLVGGVGNADFRGADTRLGFVALAAVAAAEVRRIAHDEVLRWQGRVFLPVLHVVGRVEAVCDNKCRICLPWSWKGLIAHCKGCS